MKTIHLSFMLLLISAVIYSQDLTLRELTVESGEYIFEFAE